MVNLLKLLINNVTAPSLGSCYLAACYSLIFAVCSSIVISASAYVNISWQCYLYYVLNNKHPSKEKKMHQGIYNFPTFISWLPQKHLQKPCFFSDVTQQ